MSQRCQLQPCAIRYGLSAMDCWGSPRQCEALASLASNICLAPCVAAGPAYANGKSISHVSPWSRQSKRTSPLSWPIIFSIRWDLT